MKAYQAVKRHIVFGRANRLYTYTHEPFTGGYTSFTPTPSARAIKNNLGYLYRMPKRSYKPGKRVRRRRFRRRIGRTVQPYSITRIVKTCQSFNLDPGAAGSLNSLQFKLNSAYDPSGNLGAGQPLGYDQYTALYQRAGVVSWRMKLELVSTDNTYPIVVGMTPMVSSTALTSYNHYKELPGTVSTIVTPDVDKNFLKAKGGVKRWFMPKSGRMFADDTITHGVGSDPSRILYLHLWAQDLSAANDTAAVRCVATLYQTVRFYVPEIPTRS